MGSNTTNASTPDTQAQDQTQDASALLFINVHFNLIPPPTMKNMIEKAPDQQSSFANIVRNNLAYHSNTQLIKNPDIFDSKDITIPCYDLFVDPAFECIDPYGKFLKIIEACDEVNQYLGNKVIPDNSKVQVCFNVIGYECIADVVWGFSNYLTKSSVGSVEDDELTELMTQNDLPIIDAYQDDGWSIDVVAANIVDNGLIFQVTHPYDKYLSNANVGQQDNASNNWMAPQSSSQMSLSPKLYSEAHPTLSKDRLKLSLYNDPSQAIISPMYLANKSKKTGITQKEVEKKTVEPMQSYVNGNQDAAKKKQEPASTSVLNGIHIFLDVASFIPAVSTATGIINAAIYAAEENYLFFTGQEGWEEKRNEALISLASAIPFSKLAVKGGTLVKTTAKKITSKAARKEAAELAAKKTAEKQAARKAAKNAAKEAKEARKAANEATQTLNRNKTLINDLNDEIRQLDDQIQDLNRTVSQHRNQLKNMTPNLRHVQDVSQLNKLKTQRNLLNSQKSSLESANKELTKTIKKAEELALESPFNKFSKVLGNEIKEIKTNIQGIRAEITKELEKAGGRTFKENLKVFKKSVGESSSKYLKKVHGDRSLYKNAAKSTFFISLPYFINDD